MTGSGGGPPVGPLTQDFPDKDKGGLPAHPLPSESPGQSLCTRPLTGLVCDPEPYVCRGSCVRLGPRAAAERGGIFTSHTPRTCPLSGGVTVVTLTGHLCPVQADGGAPSRSHRSCTRLGGGASSVLAASFLATLFPPPPLLPSLLLPSLPPLSPSPPPLPPRLGLPSPPQASWPQGSHLPRPQLLPLGRAQGARPARGSLFHKKVLCPRPHLAPEGRDVPPGCPSQRTPAPRRTR